MILVGQHERPITNYRGRPKSFYSDQFADSGRFLLETCMYFPFTSAKSLVGFGPDHDAMMSRFDRLQMILSLAFGSASPDYRVIIDGQGNAAVDYRLSEGVLDSLFDSTKAGAPSMFAAGARRVHAPAARSITIDALQVNPLDVVLDHSPMMPGRVSISAAHLMGGCRMGADASTTVTDGRGRVHGHPWLHVADASLLPDSARLNPYVTIMALADRVAQGVQTGLEKGG